MKKIFLLFLGVALFSVACQKDTQAEWKPKELLQYGLPITILAPDSTIVKSDDLGGGLIKDVTVKGGKDYFIQIYASQAETNDIARLKSDQLSEVKGNRFFSKIINEEADGFLYEMVIDSNTTNYGFRHIRVQGDMEYIFQPGLIGNFTLEQAERMYDAVKPIAK